MSNITDNYPPVGPKPTIKNNPIIEKAEANLAEAENELRNVQAMPASTTYQKFHKLTMLQSKSKGVTSAARILELHMLETKEGVVRR